MKNLFLFGLLILLLVAVQFASGQTVDDIINKYIDARGGKDKLNSIKSIYMEGSREMMGNEVSVKVTKEQGKLSRTDIEMGSTNGFILITDKEAWTYFPMHSSSAEKMPDDAVASLQTELDIAGPLVDYAVKGHKAELIGKDSIDGNEDYKIKLTTSTGKIINYWIDTKTYLVSQTSQKNTGGFGGRRNNAANSNAELGDVITVYKDYSAEDSILFPHTIEIKSSGGNGRGSGGTTFDKIQLNIPVDAKLYKPE
jgi:hypothetical protein